VTEGCQHRQELYWLGKTLSRDAEARKWGACGNPCSEREGGGYPYTFAEELAYPLRGSSERRMSWIIQRGQSTLGRLDAYEMPLLLARDQVIVWAEALPCTKKPKSKRSGVDASHD